MAWRCQKEGCSHRDARVFFCHFCLQPLPLGCECANFTENRGLVMPQGGDGATGDIVFSGVRCFPVFSLLSESAQDTVVDLGPGP